MRKRFLCIVLTLAIMTSLLTVAAPIAGANTFGGTTGNITWSVVIEPGETMGTLKVGPRTDVSTAAIANYSQGSRAPWFVHSPQVNRIEVLSGITEIGNWAFADFGNVNNIIVEGNVTRIGNDAFRGCINLVNFWDGNPFASEPKTFAGLTAVGANAFDNCVSLVSINMPHVTSVGANAFAGCRNHNITPVAMIVVNYFLYQFNIFGIS